MVDVIPLRYGTAFKKAFSDPEVFSAFVRDVLGVELEFTHIEQEKEFLAPRGAVDVRFDLFAEDTKNQVIVELQHVRIADAFFRFNYYHLAAQIDQVVSARDYSRAKTVYTIVVLTRMPEDENLRFDVATQMSDLVTCDGRRLNLFRDRMVFVNARCVNDSTPAPVRKWLELIEDSLDDNIDDARFPDPLMQRVIRAIETDHLTSRERYWYKEEAEWEDVKTESFQEGRDEGLKEGHDKGLKEGLRQGILDICDLLGITINERQRASLESLDADALSELRERIKLDKRWPE